MARLGIMKKLSFFSPIISIYTVVYLRVMMALPREIFDSQSLR